MIVLGVDPGITGGLALVDREQQRLIETRAMPICRIGTTTIVSNHGPWQAWAQVADLAIIERVTTRPSHANGSSLTFGMMFGGALSMLHQHGIAWRFANPSTWKKTAGLIGLPKKASLELARARFGREFRAKDEGQAEAALIALYG